jgi:hypothetical protein
MIGLCIKRYIEELNHPRVNLDKRVTGLLGEGLYVAVWFFLYYNVGIFHLLLGIEK